MNTKLFNEFYAEGRLNECIAVWLGKDPYPVLDWSDLHHYYINCNPIPSWTTNKNPWVEGSEVVEKMQCEDIIFAFMIQLGGIMVDRYRPESNYSLMMLPPEDWAKALCEVIYERGK